MTHMFDKVAELVLKYHTEEISEEEIAELNNIRDNCGLNPKMFEELLDVHRLAANFKQIKTTATKPLPKQRGIVRSLVKYGEVAAVVIPLLKVLLWSLFSIDKKADNFSFSTNSVNVIIDTMHLKLSAYNNKISINFDSMDLQDLLRHLSKDPELEVIYAEGISPLTFTGDIPSSTLYEKFAQELLEVNGYKSTIKGKKIIVHS